MTRSRKIELGILAGSTALAAWQAYLDHPSQRLKEKI